MSRTALFVSPHLDDVAFSCGGTAAALARAGWRVAVATVFTASVPNPTGFALACQLDKGLPADVDYMALRRAEDEEFGRAVGAELLWLGFAEAPHRGYGSAAALFSGARPDDGVWEAVAGRLAALAESLRPDGVFAPQGLGGHVDHAQVVRAIRAVPGLCARAAWYRDTPYALRDPAAAADPSLPGGLGETFFDISDTLIPKIAGAAAFRTQVGFQFGGEAALRERLTAFARAEAARGGLAGAAEAFRAGGAAAELLGGRA